MTYKENPAYNTPLAQRLRRLVFEEKKDSITGIAEKSGMNRQQISDYANGKTVPKSDALAKIAKALNVSADYLLGLSDDETDGKSTDFFQFTSCAEIIKLIDHIRFSCRSKIAVSDTEYGESYNPVQERYETIIETPAIFTLSLEDPNIAKYYKEILRMDDFFKQAPSFQAAQDYRKRVMDSMLQEMRDKYPEPF